MNFFRKYKKHLIILSIVVILAIAMKKYFEVNDLKTDNIDEVTYTEFLEMVEKDKVDTVYYNTTSEVMTFTLLNDETKDMDWSERAEYKYDDSEYRKTFYPSYEEFRKDMLENDVRLEVKKTDSFVGLITTIISLLIPCLWVYLIYKMMTNQTKGLSEDSLIQESNICFDDIIGQDEILDDIKFITELIKNPKKGDKIGAKTPKGILLSGEPGTGKTLIAKAIAGEAGVPFIYMNASGFKELYVGMGAKRVRDLFKIARKNSPCIIFIDEIDAVGAKRNARGSSSEDDQTINALLTEMDGFESKEGIFIIGATNRPDKLDSALVRAGRFDRQIVVNPPRDWKVRKQLFEHYLSNFSLNDDINIENLSKQVVGFTGADIAMICNEASIIAVMKDLDYINNSCIEEAIDKKIFKGNRSKTEHYKDDKKIIAYHESGHAVMTYLLKQPIARASIIGTTSGVGGVVFRTESDSVFTTDKEIKEQVLIAYAGRASEEIKFGIVTTGASNDISSATDIMLKYIELYGFDKDFGLLDMNLLQESSIIENSAIVDRLSEMSKTLYEECLSILKDNFNLVERLALKLLDVETMSGEQIEQLLSVKEL